MRTRAVVLLLIVSAWGCALQPQPSDRPARSAAALVTANPAPAVSATAFPSPLVLSVLYFEDRARVPELRWLRKGLTDMLIAELARRPDVLIVQRERLDEVIREQSLHVTGRVSDDSAVRIGGLVGATALVTGSFSVIQDRVKIDAQFVGVEEGTILAAAGAEGLISEAPSVASSLVGKVVVLLPGLGAQAARRPVRAQTVEAAIANDAGETLTREGKLFQALREYETAMDANPTYDSARSNYKRTLLALPVGGLLKPEDGTPSPRNDRQILAWVVERLAGSGLDAEIGAARVEDQADGSLALALPVRLQLRGSSITAVQEAVRALGGTVDSHPGGEGPIEFTLSSRPDLNRRLVLELSKPRRVYLRLLTSGGRTVAVFSELQGWHLGKWIHALDDQRIRIDPREIAARDARVTGLTGQQVKSVARAKVTVDLVPRERATVRLDLRAKAQVRQRPRTQEAQGRDAGAAGSMPAQQPHASTLPCTACLESRLEALRNLVRQAWNPGVVERPWARGYLPGNTRRAVVGFVLQSHGRALVAPPRLIRRSGEDAFDEASLEAVRVATERWISESEGRPSGQAMRESGESRRVRVQFQLIKDVPGLNLITAQRFAQPIIPARRPRSTPH